jgi:asparagine synthase (glutamine-hydrolysing)
MCGITGYRAHSGDASGWAQDLPAAIASLHHRGPDDEGKWYSTDHRTGLGHRRLAILDLSAHGHQPMHSACRQWTMVYNGEIYNFREIRRDLEALGHRFVGSGDSEVALAAFAQWGPGAVTRFTGMFTFALWHEPRRELHLLRDRLGVKPLYYYWDGKVLAFGSELKAIRAFRAWTPQIDPHAIRDFLRYSYINDPRSIYRNVFKLPPAHHLRLAQDGRIELRRYWNIIDHLDARRHRSESDLEEELESLMIEAFRHRMVSDVPVGVFLSGGIDSSILSAILQKHHDQQIKTFTIGFDSPDYDESRYAAAVADHLGTEHHSRVLRVEDAKALLPRWGDLYDEPFGDESGIPTLLVSKVAAERVKVVLSADGGDELFSGYNSYESAIRQWDRAQALPLQLRRMLAGGLRSIRLGEVDDWLAEHAVLGGLTEGFRGGVTTRLSKIGTRVGAAGPGGLFDAALAHFRSAELASLLGDGRATREDADRFPGCAGERYCLWDLHNYLPGNILVKVDRATMAVSIEGRDPLIDHKLVEFAYSIPFNLRRGELGAKHILRKVLYRYVPRELVDRPKRGFGAPVKHWLATSLQSLVVDYLDPAEVSRQAIFEPGAIARYVSRMKAGDETVRQRIWLLVAFQMWYRRWMTPGSEAVVEA